MYALASSNGGWSGSAGELLEAVTPDKPGKDWPATPRGMAGALRRCAPALRRVGIAVEHDPDARPRRWTLARENPQTTDATDGPSGQAADQHKRPDGWPDGSTDNRQPTDKQATVQNSRSEGVSDGSDGSSHPLSDDDPAARMRAWTQRQRERIEHELGEAL